MAPQSGIDTGSRVPAFWAALAFAAGIVAAWLCWRPPLWWAAAALVLVLASSVLTRSRPAYALLCASAGLVALGALAFSARSQSFADDLQRRDLAAYADGSDVVVTATVARDGVLRQSGSLVRQIVDLEVESVSAKGNAIQLQSGLRLNVYVRDKEDETSPAMGMFRHGERLRFPAKLRPPRNFGNPGAWDYRGYLAGRGITALASVRADRIEELEAAPGDSFNHWRSALRRQILERIHELWSGRQAALVDAMLIGEKSYLDRRTQTEFQRSGTYHILVVSGMNVGILAFVVFWLLRRLRVSDVAASALTVLLSAGYAFLADAGAPIVRATLMLAIALGARLLYRERALLNSLGLAALIVLAVDPQALFDASFQLTFISVLAIVAIAVPLLERTSLPYRRALRHLDSTGYDLALAPKLAQFRLDVRLLASRLGQMIGQRVATWLVVTFVRTAVSVYDVVLVSAVAQLGLALPMAMYFHRATVLALPANILVVPITGVLMPASAAAVALSFVARWAAKPFAWVAGLSLEFISSTVSVLGNLRAAEVRVAAPSTALVVASVAAFILAAFAARRRPALAASGLVTLLTAAVWLAVVPPRPQLRAGVLEVTTLDVGQADAIFVVTPDGRTLLIDAAGSLGPANLSDFDFGEDVISPYLWGRGIIRLDAVALTHAHSDHIGGMGAVLANFRPRELWLGPNALTPALTSLMRQASEQEMAVIGRIGGNEFRFGDSEVRVLAPPRHWRAALKPRNDDSLVLRIAYKKSAVLLAADAERKMERWIAGQQPQADLLKVGHNGSATSTSPELLAAVSPRWAVISVGFRNRFRHPRPEVLARLAAAGTSTFRTDTMGAVTFYLDGKAAQPAPR